jgi:ssDNA-binding Zn-finger/Zn-ribbon topoisomerase 1
MCLCGAKMRLRETTKFRYPNGDARKFWGCTRYPECKGIRPSHPDGTAYGIPGDAATKLARNRAHRAFDAWWRGRGMKRSHAYAVLRNSFRLPEELAHISCFSVDQCEQLVAMCEAAR